MVIIVMGPAGAGKSTIARALAADLGWMFIDGDDRRPDLLRELHGIMARVMDRRDHLVLACAALTGEERSLLQGDLRPVRFVYLKAPRAELEARLSRRAGGGADTAALHAQLLVLEDPGDQAVVVDATKAPDVIVPTIRRELGF
ncbi:MAG: AAA family ATPase [Vicinamibacterales bacterium]